MSEAPSKVVFDCNIFVQALINLRGPAGRCVQKARDGEVKLFVSPFILAEIREIYLKTPVKYGITAKQTEELASALLHFATLLSDVPELYVHPLDSDDSAYVNLALKADAKLIVSRDRHLLNLADATRSEGKDFQSRFPKLRIVEPVEFLRESEISNQDQRAEKPAT